MTFLCTFSGRKKDRSGNFADRTIRVTAADEAAARQKVGEDWEVSSPIDVEEFPFPPGEHVRHHCRITDLKREP